MKLITAAEARTLARQVEVRAEGLAPVVTRFICTEVQVATESFGRYVCHVMHTDIRECIEDFVSPDLEPILTKVREDLIRLGYEVELRDTCVRVSWKKQEETK